MIRLYYSASQNGFFSDDVHASIPEDSVPITQAEHQSLLKGQEAGRRIAAGPDGKPVLIPD